MAVASTKPTPFEDIFIYFWNGYFTRVYGVEMYFPCALVKESMEGVQKERERAQVIERGEAVEDEEKEGGRQR